jgi:hypothetical protein
VQSAVCEVAHISLKFSGINAGEGVRQAVTPDAIKNLADITPKGVMAGRDNHDGFVVESIKKTPAQRTERDKFQERVWLLCTWSTKERRPRFIGGSGLLPRLHPRWITAPDHEFRQL